MVAQEQNRGLDEAAKKGRGCYDMPRSRSRSVSIEERTKRITRNRDMLQRYKGIAKSKYRKNVELTLINN